jgi:hypothetical protein
MDVTITTRYHGPTNTRGSRITARYHGPTNTRGSRITATGHSRQLTVPYNYALGVVDNHGAVARALAIVLGYTGDLRTVPARIGNGYRWQSCA